MHERRDELNQKARENYIANRDKRLRQCADYRIANRDELNQKAREKYKANPTEGKRKSRAYRAANRDKLNQKAKIKARRPESKEKQKKQGVCIHGRKEQKCTEDSCALVPSYNKCVVGCGKTVCQVKDVPSSRYCAKCRHEYGVGPKGRRKIFEEQMETWLAEENLRWTLSGKKIPCAPTTRYPDYLFRVVGHCVLLEVDENEHEFYSQKCEITRISEIALALTRLHGSISLHVIRYNPQAVGKTTQERREEIISVIRDALAYNFGQHNDTGIVVQYVGYSRDRIDALDQVSCDLQREALDQAKKKRANK